MSAAKMVADSTQSEFVTDHQPSRSKRQKNGDGKKTKKGKKSSQKDGKQRKNASSPPPGDDSDLDLDKPLSDIGSYVKDRQEMLDHMFHSVRGASLQRALPDILKDLPLEDLKRRCLEQLEVMSKKRIRGILAGDNPATISSSGTEDDTSDEESAGDKRTSWVEDVTQSHAADSTSQTGEPNSDSGATSGQDFPDDGQNMADGELPDNEEEDQPMDFEDSPDDVSDRIDDSEEGEYNSSVEGGEELDEEREEGEVEVDQRIQKGKDKISLQSEPLIVSKNRGDNSMQAESYDSTKKKAEKIGDAEDDIAKSIQNQLDNRPSETAGSVIPVQPQNQLDSRPSDAAGSIFPVLTQNQMELLELEMRARAIKAMLRKHDVKKS